MSGITIMSKQPPGGRCSLYMRYAETLRQKLGIEFDVRFCDEGAEVPPPAMLIDDVVLAPSDGVILSPEDIAERSHFGDLDVPKCITSTATPRNPAVERTYLAQALDPPCYSKKVLITTQVTTHFFDTQIGSISHTLHPRPTAGFRIINTNSQPHRIMGNPAFGSAGARGAGNTCRIRTSHLRIPNGVKAAHGPGRGRGCRSSGCH